MQQDKEVLNEDIDYLHPYGKPINEPAEDDPVDHKPDLMSYRKALEEADGHSMYKPDPFLDKPPLE